jgi:hypothetical protein
VAREDQFDSGIWEQDDPMHGVEGMIIALACLYSNLRINQQLIDLLFVFNRK